MKKLIIILLIAASIIFAVIIYVTRINASQSYVASGHPEWAPIMWRDNEKIIGAGPDLVKMIFSELGIKIDLMYTGAWDEVQAKAKGGEVDVLAAAYKTTERETYMDYSVPYTIDPIALFIKKGSDFKYSEWKDLIGKRGIATVGDSYGQEFDDYIKEKLNVVRVSTAAEAFAAVVDGKADYFVYALYSGEKAIKEQKLENKIEIAPTYVASENFYITISKKSPLVKYLDQINELLAEYKSDGTIDSLVEKNKKVAY
ncbi:MAG: transporter substrate-binding domain-containing protein [Patescibacteria group bacterium]|nr:transporter substrate-binding domain-containing protein [Patescibacteria group bacterium]MDD4610432.1 transporter substrate-binding domain-containing protein [Patescibacteria group bacterium]